MHIMQKLCRNYAKKIMQKLCKNYAKIMQKLCKNYAMFPDCIIMHALCKNYANYAKIMQIMQVSKNYANYASPTLLMNDRKCCVNGKVESGALKFALSRSYIELYRNAGIVEYFSVPFCTL